MTLLHQAAQKALEALQLAHAGLEWYRDRFSEVVDGSDDEADEKIGDALVALESALQQQPEPVAAIGWLYDWTHSSALGKPDEQFTSFTTDEAHARKHDNPRAVYTTPPALQHQEVPCGNTPYDEGPFTIATDCGQEVPREPVAWQCACGESTRAGWTHRRGWCNEGGLAEFETAASPSTTRQQEVGSGWKLVPVEPTDEMLAAARSPQTLKPKEHFDSANKKVYQRMVLAAAPSTPEKAGGVTEVATRCGSYECRAAQQDGVLCADGECDRVNGARPAGAALAPAILVRPCNWPKCDPSCGNAACNAPGVKTCGRCGGTGEVRRIEHTPGGRPVTCVDPCPACGVAASQAPALMEITYELRGRCFWHSNCTAQRHAPPMKFAGHPTRDGKMGSLLECTACGQRGWYQAGWIGLARVPVEPAADGVAAAGPARLWAMHIAGPDDVHAAPGEAEARAAAERFNEWFAQRKDPHPLDPQMHATAIEWPHSAEAHANDLPRWRDFVPPAAGVEGKCECGLSEVACRDPLRRSCPDGVGGNDGR